MELRFPEVETPDQDALEKGRLLFAGETEFLKGVVAMDGLPPSNVGKSSLINALTGRKGLARASNTPGRTQEINYFTAGDIFVVDLPGYGYANAPLPVVEKWQRLLKNYLQGRQTLRRVFVLIDARHGAKEVDDEIMTLLDRSAVTFQVVMTKVDKLKGDALQKSLDKTRAALAKHPAAFPELLLQALPYLQRYAGAVVVVKFGGNAMGDDAAMAEFARDIVLMKQVGVNPVVVHGGGPMINQMLDKLGIASEFVRGKRASAA